MPTPNADKEQVINLVRSLLRRSGLTIKQVVARMQVHGSDITRSSFENQFTTRINRVPSVSPESLLALIAAFAKRLANHERCTAAEAIELARLARLPIDKFKTLQSYFPIAEFKAAYSHYAPLIDLTLEEQSMLSRALVSPGRLNKSFDVILTCLPEDEPVVKNMADYLAREGLTLWPTICLLTYDGSWPSDLNLALPACNTWLICFGPQVSEDWIATRLNEPPYLSEKDVVVIPVLLPGTRQELCGRLPRFLQHRAWLEFHEKPADEGLVATLHQAVQGSVPIRQKDTSDVWHDPDCSD